MKRETVFYQYNYQIGGGAFAESQKLGECINFLCKLNIV